MDGARFAFGGLWREPQGLVAMTQKLAAFSSMRASVHPCGRRLVADAAFPLPGVRREPVHDRELREKILAKPPSAKGAHENASEGGELLTLVGSVWLSRLQEQPLPPPPTNTLRVFAAD
jgi:hypothetical protein